MQNNKIITIDGPAGVGKGTISEKIARQYHFNYLDSGAIYRLAAIELMNGNSPNQSVKKICKDIEKMHIQFKLNEKSGVSVYLNNIKVDEQLRLEETGKAASELAAIPEVRACLLNIQRNFGNHQDLVADGRDMGTVVFPSAQLKFFLDASVQIRAERRYKQLKTKGENVNLADLEKAISERDDRDRNRSISPLKPASDAVIIDTSQLSVKQVFEKINQYIQARFLT